LALGVIYQNEEAEADLTASELARLLELLPEPALVFQNGQILLANCAGRDLLNANRPEELNGKPLSDLLHPIFPEAGGDWPEQAPGPGDEPVRSEAVYFTCDGDTVDVGTTTSALLVEGQRAMLVLARDLTDRKRTELELSKRDAQLKHALRIAKLGAWTWDYQTDQLLLSPECAEILGLPFTEDLETSSEGFVRTFVHPDDRDRVTEIYAAPPLSAPIMDLEFRIRRPDGTVRNVHEVGETLFGSGGRPLIEIGFLQDITDLVESAKDLEHAKELAEESSRFKSEFLSMISHELRTPLNAIIGFAEVLEQNLPDSSECGGYVEYAADIASSGKHLLGQIDDILDLSKIESGTYHLREEETTLKKILANAMKSLEETADENIPEIEIRLPEDLPALVADPRALRHAFSNLLSNACRFNEDGERIDVMAGMRTDGSMLITISDEGIGMTENGIDAALVPFRQGETSMARKHDGLGLGLPLSRAIIDLHGGHLTIRSELAIGTCIEIRLPSSRCITR